MGFNVGPRVSRATGGSISRQGNFVVHQFPPQHVTDGLVGFVDPSNHDSYDELRQTTINDISGAGIMGRPGIAASLFNTLSREGINLRLIATSEVKVSCVIDSNLGLKSLRSVTDTFELNESQIKINFLKSHLH